MTRKVTNRLTWPKPIVMSTGLRSKAGRLNASARRQVAILSSEGLTRRTDRTSTPISATRLPIVQTACTNPTLANVRCHGAKSSAANGGYVNGRLVFGRTKEYRWDVKTYFPPRRR